MVNKLARVYRLFLLFLGFLVFVNCGDSKIVFEDNVIIPLQQWSYENTPSFSFRINDASKKYDIKINFRHNKDYKFSNMFILLHEKAPHTRDTAYRHELQLAELDGRWIGDASGGLYHIELLAKENFMFPDTGNYTYAIEQNMRINPLIGVNDIGIKVVEKE